MSIKLLAADMDGTLLNDNHQLTPRTADAIKNWVASGRHFIPSTGRPLCGLDFMYDVLTKDTPFIVYNGAMAIKHMSKEVIFSITLPADIVPEIYEQGKKHDIPIIIWSNEKLYTNRLNEYTNIYQEAVNAITSTVISDCDIRTLANEGVSKIIWMDYPQNVVKHQQEMQAHFGSRINCHASRPELFEFVHPSASKASALEKIAQSLNISQKQTAAIGDSYNDVSMLKYAEISVAMANAPNDIKNECSHVTLTNNEDGVAVWMEDEMNRH